MSRLIYLATLLIMLFFISSCSKEKLLLLDTIESRWSSVYLYQDLTQGLIEGKEGGKEAIVRPPNAWVALLQVERFNQQGLARDCLIYRTPYRQAKGELRLIALRSKDDSCAALPNMAGELPLASLEEIEGVRVKTHQGKFQLWWKDALKPEEQKYETIFYNWKEPRKFKIYDSPVAQTQIPGVIILTMGDSFPVDARVGKMEDNYSDKSAVICHQVNQDCISLSANTCDRCRYGWYSLSNTQCPQGGTKICGVNRCGEKGEPACARGFNYRNYKIDSACVDDSPAAFCKPGLRVMCDSEKNLICY